MLELACSRDGKMSQGHPLWAAGVALCITLLGLFALMMVLQAPVSVIAAPQLVSTSVLPNVGPLGGATMSPTSTATRSCGAQWHLVSSANQGNSDNSLASVASFSTGDVWAVGSYSNSGGVYRTLVEHWDGSAWTIIMSPNNSTWDNYLTGISGVSSDDLWAVGYYSNGSTLRTLSEHWDGSGWSIVSSPNVGGGYNYLEGVTTITGSDVWTVGFVCANNCQSGVNTQSLAMHWDGSVWTVATVPNVVGEINTLTAVDSGSSGDVWAVGEHAGCYGCVARTLMVHWDGTAWTIAPSSNAGSSTNDLAGVTVISPTDAWAVGYYYANPLWRTLTLHWDGTIWNVVPSPNIPPGSNYLYGVTAIASNDVWAVGRWDASSGVTLHWDGTQWTSVPSPIIGSGTNYLFGVAAIASDYVWSVGTNVGTSSYTLTQVYSDDCATPTSTVTPGGPTFTPTRTTTSTITRTATNTLTPTNTPTSVCGVRWRQVSSPNPGNTGNYLLGVVAISSSDVWEVGAYNYNGGNRTLTEHWDGTAWTPMPSPNSGTGDNELNAVAAVSDTDIWAVGTYYNGSLYQTLTEHWDGFAWSIVSSPNFGGGYNYLQGVTAISPNNAWAVGWACFSNCQGAADAQSLVLHWNGSAWNVVVVPNVPGQSNELAAVTSSGPNDVWAVGEHHSCLGCVALTLTLHWDGTQWSIIPSPNAGGSTNYMSGVAVLSPNNAWAVGYYYTGSVWRTLTIHWDGIAWNIVPSPNVGQGTNYLLAISAASANDIWAVGWWGASTGVTLHWDGSAWSIVPSPLSATGTAWLDGVSAKAADNVWAVGYSTNAPQLTLTQLYNDPCVTATPTATSSPTSPPTTIATNSPTITNTPVNTATRIDTPSTTPTSTHTLVATPTLCAIAFSDVPPGSTFYTYIRCLACRGIVSGYSDGTFKPNNNITRGQLSKIVSNAAGFSDLQPNQMFQDVPVDSTFQLYIGRLASRGYITGYACGGPGEPCQPGNLPYFRPNNNATRGQITKIDANAANYSDDPTGQQFEDVAVGSTYYTYTYRLVGRSIMSGYPCGGAGEPCGPGNLPYFRPNNNATRGQTSKIVANTFFPNCQTPDVVRR